MVGHPKTRIFTIKTSEKYRFWWGFIWYGIIIIPLRGRISDFRFQLLRGQDEAKRLFQRVKDAFDLLMLG